MILGIHFLMMLSSTFNGAIYTNAVKGMMTEFHMDQQAALAGSAVYLLANSFGTQLWAPWSEELGRRTIIQLSLTAINIFQLPCALAPNYASVIVGRFFTAIFQASGSIIFGVVADMWHTDHQAYPVAFSVLAYVGGTAIGPIIGPFFEAYTSWRWVFWIQLILGGIIQMMHLLFVPETRSSVLIDREAKRRRETQGEDVWGPIEVKPVRFTSRDIVVIWFRPVSHYFDLLTA